MTHRLYPSLCSITITAVLLLSACTSEESSQQSTMLADSHSQELSSVVTARPLTFMPQSVITSASEAPVGKVSRQQFQPVIADSSAVYRHIPAPRERYESLDDNKVMETGNESVSTFSIDVDTGSYANVRRFLQSGALPPVDAVRVEEMLNYFSYDYPAEATVEQPFSVVTELGSTPWNSNTKLLHIGLNGYVPPDTTTLPANLVFLIDVSGSMDRPDKLGLLKSSIGMLANELVSSDTVSIVVYAGSSGVVLPPTAGNKQKVIHRALSRLRAGGSTNGAQGIELAYELATDNFIEEGINRVILATDGDFNVGMRDTDELKKLIARKRESGIALTTLGFGTGNYNDHMMEQLADTGNGSYAYIDTLAEARKVLVDERYATMMQIAGDVKIQVEFNPERVTEYRLIGYTNRLLANEDFNNDKVDAGEIGAGHTVTALYEVALRGDGGERVPALRYQKPHITTDSEYSDELAEIRLRYKLPGEQQSRFISETVSEKQLRGSAASTSDNFRFSASVAALGQLLRRNNYINTYSYEDVGNLARSSVGADPHSYRAEFIRLVDLAASIEQLQRASNGIQNRDEG